MRKTGNRRLNPPRNSIRGLAGVLIKFQGNRMYLNDTPDILPDRRLKVKLLLARVV